MYEVVKDPAYGSKKTARSGLVRQRQRIGLSRPLYTTISFKSHKHVNVSI